MAGVRIHPRAVVDAAADLSSDVQIGPFAVIGPNVRLGPGVRVYGHAMIEGHTEVGEGAEVFPFAVLGQRPQDRKFDGSDTRIAIGRGTVIREYVTVHPGSRDGGRTVIGEDTLVMAYGHVAHDCRIGDRVTMANAVQIAGHCEIEDGAVLGGLTNVHQFARVGRHAMTGAATRVVRDVLPYSLVDGHPARWVGLNAIGLRRAGFSDPVQRRLKRGLRGLFATTLAEGVARLEAEVEADPDQPGAEEIRQLLAFVRASHRGLTRPRRRRGAKR